MGQITLVVRIGFQSRSYTVIGYRYAGSGMVEIEPIQLTQSVFDATLRSGGWATTGCPSHQRKHSQAGDQWVADQYHYVLVRGKGINRLNAATDLQEFQAQRQQLRSFVYGGVKAPAERISVYGVQN